MCLYALHAGPLGRWVGGGGVVAAAVAAAAAAAGGGGVAAVVEGKGGASARTPVPGVVLSTARGDRARQVRGHGGGDQTTCED